MSESKKRKNEIEMIKAGKAIRIRPDYDDYDAAGEVIQKAAKFVHETIGEKSYAYHIESWMGKALEGKGDAGLKAAIDDCLLIGENPDRVKRVKGAVVELLKFFSEEFMTEGLSPDGGKHPGRITNQQEMDNAVKHYFRPMNYGHTFGEGPKTSYVTLAHKNDDGSWTKQTILGNPFNLADILNGMNH